MNILIVEDDHHIRKLNTAIMKLRGFEVDAASDGIEAVEYVEKNKGKYDLCLMDINMPKMDGLEATRRIRDNYAYFPIMGLTANPSYKNDCFNAGMDEFVQKPYSLNKLLTLIDDLTVKITSIKYSNETISITRVMPMNSEELLELRELEKNDLALLIIEQGRQRFVVHKNIQNKMSHVLIGEDKELFEFLDRGENPANCHLYKCNMQTNRLLLTPEQFEQRVQAENSDIENYISAVDQNLTSEEK